MQWELRRGSDLGKGILARIAVLIVALGVILSSRAQPFHLPTANRALFDADGGADRFFVPTAGKTWISGTFGGVRSNGRQLHEGLDIRCLQRDKRGEPADPVMATADGSVAYVNRRSSLSNYGIYVIVRHEIDGIEIYSTYAHLRDVRGDLRHGVAVKAGERIGTMGRTANTREGISRDRAHVHFELNLFVNDAFPAWHKKNHPGQRNDHGEWNGLNLLGLDPRAILLEQQRLGGKFNLVKFIQGRTELCRVAVQAVDFPWLKRYAALASADTDVKAKHVAGYEIALDFNGIPLLLIPRTASELKGKGRLQLLSVNESEALSNGSRRLVAKRGAIWELAENGKRALELLIY
jgi:murein DD-endopeptidase MepM/ murein hydrolase activator NlpD